jgi:hypothetical protein
METMYQRSKIKKNPFVYEMLKLQEIPIIGVNTFLSSKVLQRLFQLK